MRSIVLDRAIVAGALLAGATAWALFIHAMLPGVLR